MQQKITTTNISRNNYTASNHITNLLKPSLLLLLITMISPVHLMAGNGKSTNNFTACVSGNASATNVKYYVNGQLVSGLRGNVTPGSKVKVTFTTLSNTTETRFSLVSYKAPAATFDPYTADQQIVFDFKTDEFKKGNHSFEVDVPNCFFQVDFVRGCIIEKLGPAASANFYSAQSRLIDADNSGTSQCICQSLISVKVPAAFATGYADTVVTHKANFKNLSSKINDRININVQSQNNWKIEMRSISGNTLYATDNNGDGNWDYVNASYDLDHDGRPETSLLNKSNGIQSYNFKVYVPANVASGTFDTLNFFGSSFTDRCDKDMANAVAEIEQISALPIVLISFKATAKSDLVKLEWTTALEINNEYFTIERSSNGTDFKEILFVNGAGNTNSISHYSIEDKDALSGPAYYRLKQTDFDGQSATSAVVVVNANMTKTISIHQDVYPNPFTGSFQMGFSVENRGYVIITLMDVRGKLISTNTISADKGSNQYSFEEGNSLPAGLYFVSLAYNGEVISSKIARTAF
jgi:hypothetical protein